MNTKRLRVCFLLVDLGFVVYWIAALFHLFPTDYLFKDYDNPILQAWNFSFLPLDLLVSASGLSSLWLQARRRPGWELLAMVSLTLTMCSGLQAIAFWALRRDYDMTWWGPNMFLTIYPLFFLCPLIYRTLCGGPGNAGETLPSGDPGAGRGGWPAPLVGGERGQR